MSASPTCKLESLRATRYAPSMRLRVFIAFAFLAIAGCASTTVRPIIARNGAREYFVGCGDLPACTQRASDTCPSGYDKLDERSGAAGKSGNPEPKDGLLIRCKNPDEGPRAGASECYPEMWDNMSPLPEQHPYCQCKVEKTKTECQPK